MSKDVHFWSLVDRDEPKIHTSNLDEKLQLIDSLMHHVIEDLSKSVVGIAVGIVAEGKVVYSKGFGLREYADKTSNVTSDTIFSIGSCTKAFTAYALEQQIVNDGKLRWTDKVIDHVPEFRLFDVPRTNHIHVKDCMTHSSGLPAHFMSMYYQPVPRKELLSRIPFLEPNFGLREKYQYSNLMVTLAGIVSERVDGLAWEDIMRIRIFEPLGMTRTYASDRVMKAINPPVHDVAKPHQFNPDSVITTLETVDITNLAPSGSIVASINDMSKWVCRQVNLTGRFKEMHFPQLALQSDLTDGETFAYALGWMVSGYHGRIMVNHAGSVPGAVSQVTLFPNHKQGIVVLTNIDTLGVFNVNLSARIADILTEYSTITDRDNQLWVKKQGLTLPKSVDPVSGSNKKTDENVPVIDNPEQYVGKYHHSGYGPLEIFQSGTQVIVRYGTIDYTLSPKENPNVFRAQSGFPHAFQFQGSFLRDDIGDIISFSFDLEPQSPHPILFKRLVPDELQSPQYLNAFAGTYIQDKTQVDITVNQNLGHLVASGPSLQATVFYAGEMSPMIKRNWFQLTNGIGVRYEFTFTGETLSGMNVHIGEMSLQFRKRGVLIHQKKTK